MYLSATKASPHTIQARLRDTMSDTSEALQATSDFTLKTSDAVRSSEDIAAKVAAQIHHEISRLRHMQFQSEMGIEYVAWGWMGDAWTNIQPGKRGMKYDRERAAEFLKEVLRVVDEGTVVSLSVSDELPATRCSSRTLTISPGFLHAELHVSSTMRDKYSRLPGSSTEGIVRPQIRFKLCFPTDGSNVPSTLSHDRLSMYQRLTHLSPSIESLEQRLEELRKSDTAPALIQGPTSTPGRAAETSTSSTPAASNSA